MKKEHLAMVCYFLVAIFLLVGMFLIESIGFVWKVIGLFAAFVLIKEGLKQSGGTKTGL